jgi:D-sedoheptulose 7-phosphate isomerase
MTFAERFLDETRQIVDAVDTDSLERVVERLAAVRSGGGRLFVLGVGGSAAHASHAVNDFRKICGLEAYTPTDNVAELTARTNDEGWDTTFVEWLRTSRLSAADAVLVFSVGGGDSERGVSRNLVLALDLARERGSTILGIVGRDGGHTERVADACVVIPPLFPDRITPHTEGLCAVLWHLVVSHPTLQANATMWESVSDGLVQSSERRA